MRNKCVHADSLSTGFIGVAEIDQPLDLLIYQKKTCALLIRFAATFSANNCKMHRCIECSSSSTIK